MTADDLGELVALAQPLTAATPPHPVHGVVGVRVERPFPPDRPRGCHIAVTHLDLAVHLGTHVDAPRHFFPDAPAIDQYPLERFVRPAVTVHLAREGAVAVSASDLRPHLLHAREGDFVLLSFGYATRYGTAAYEDHPYLTRDAAELLVELRVAALGVDVMTPDAPVHRRDPAFDWPVHRTLLGSDVLIFENLGPGLTRIAGRRVPVSAVPLPIDSGDGSLLSPYAILPRGG